jgi:Zn-dependent peptidase ImmA (M78 family)
VSRWSYAHSIAHIAAQRARSDAGWAPTQRAEVIELIEASGVQVFGEHGTKLFGALLPAEEGRAAGVWLNAGLTVTSQRHTAAHEWGHHRLDHGPTCDLGIEALGSDRSAAMRSLEETTAEAFAAWLLMPRPALTAALRTLSATGAPSPLQCYETALLLGTSYRGTARHLATARLIDRDTSTQLMRIPPGRIKQVLDEPTAPAPMDSRADVWRLAHFGAAEELVVAAGDRLIVDHTDTDTTDALLAVGRATMVAETDTAVVLTALGQDDRLPMPAETIRIAGNPVRFRVDQPVIGLADPNTIPDLSTLTADEIDRLLADLHPQAIHLT